MSYSDEEITRVWEESLPLRKRAKMRWEMQRSRDKDFIFEVAKSLGWLDKPQKVQVRLQREATLRGEPNIYYVIEPYEEDCSCPDIIPPSEFNKKPVTSEESGP